jgi:23S rRNA (uracil1939-C5)-methyltransferase
MLVGFHEKRSSYVADMRTCRVLPREVSDLLVPLRALLGGMSRPDRLPQIELAVGEGVTVLTLRHMEPLTDDDTRKLSEFGAAHGVCWWLQPKGPDSVHPLHPQDAGKLAYALPEFGLRMAYKPTDFTQVNHQLNRALVSRALRLLQVEAHHRVADMFCGLGNFSLPLATRAAAVLGVEGSETLTRRAQEAASANGLAHKTEFMACNLFEVDAAWLRARGRFDRMLIDPPREGAEALAQALCELTPEERPARIVYVSCNPATLARDAAILTRQGGWRLSAAGVMNMFPHTAHVESIAIFT